MTNGWALTYARGEFAHTLTAAFLAAGFLTFVLAQRHSQTRATLPALWICGLACGFAGIVHPSVAIVGGTFAITLPAFHCIRRKAEPGTQVWIQIAKGWLALLLGFITPYLLAGAFLGFPYVVESTSSSMLPARTRTSDSGATKHRAGRL